MAEILEHLGTALFLTTRNGTLVAANRAGREALQEQRMALRNGRLEPRDTRSTPVFLRRLAKAAGLGPEQALEPEDETLLVGNEDRRALATFLPLRSSAGTERGAEVAVFLKPLVRAQFPLVSLGAALSWTSAETRLAEALLAGSSLSDLAFRWRLSRETLKSEARTLYGKTGVSRQSELVATVLTLLSHRIF